MHCHLRHNSFSPRTINKLSQFHEQRCNDFPGNQVRRANHLFEHIVIFEIIFSSISILKVMTLSERRRNYPLNISRVNNGKLNYIPNMSLKNIFVYSLIFCYKTELIYIKMTYILPLIL